MDMDLVALLGTADVPFVLLPPTVAQPSPPPATAMPAIGLPFAPPPPLIVDERESNVNTEGVTVGLGVGIPAACLLLCLMLTCYLHRVSGGSIPTYLRVKLSHSNPNMMFLYLPEETRRKMASAIISRRSTMPTVSEELGFKKPRSAGLDHAIGRVGKDFPSFKENGTPPAVASASAGPMPAPYEAQMAFAANADASATAMAAMAAAEAAVKAPAESKAGPAQEDEDEPCDDTLQGDSGRRRKKRPPPPDCSKNSGDVTPNELVATGGMQETEYEEQALKSYQEGDAHPNIGDDMASSAADRRRSRRPASNGSSAYGSGLQQEAAAAASAMTPGTPYNMHSPGDEEEEDEEEMIRRLAWIKYYVKYNENDKALELGWDGDMSFITASDEPAASISSTPAAGVGSGTALTVDPQKTMCRI
jgi:hypothetical protein